MTPSDTDDFNESTDSQRWLHGLDFVMLLRPTVLMPVWTLMLLGAYQARDASHPLIWLTPPASLLWSFLFYSLIMGAVYILNQLTDAATDALNNKLYLLAQGHVSRSAAIVEMVLLAVFGYSLAWILVPAGASYRWLLLISGVLGIAYSLPPIRLKGKPLLDLLANALGYGGVAYALGWTCVTSASDGVVRMALPYVFCVAATFVHSTLLDREGDARGGDRTTGVLLGSRVSCVLSFLLILGAVVTSIWSRNWISLLAASLSLPLFGVTLFRRSDQAIAGAMRLGVAVLTLITAVLIPYYLGVLLLMVFGVRWYYRRRFGIRYPF